MLNEIKIKELIRHGENATLEFKEAGRDSLPSSLFDTICAFLNAEGGIILLGVKDDGEVSGVHPDCVAKLKADLANLANNPQKLDPVFIIGATDYAIDGKIVIY
ncbi:MAG: hypothetical protein A2X45_02390 [Lentisphaerae bacterium GWF2_50_93]|nr:MAG: hypothetical protein A2X45_02390 [Lentisphaerae bacterium GWF2_50_93]